MMTTDSATSWGIGSTLSAPPCLSDAYGTSSSKLIKRLTRSSLPEPGMAKSHLSGLTRRASTILPYPGRQSFGSTIGASALSSALVDCAHASEGFGSVPKAHFHAWFRCVVAGSFRDMASCFTSLMCSDTRRTSAPAWGSMVHAECPRRNMPLISSIWSELTRHLSNVNVRATKSRKFSVSSESDSIAFAMCQVVVLLVRMGISSFKNSTSNTRSRLSTTFWTTPFKWEARCAGTVSCSSKGSTQPSRTESGCHSFSKFSPSVGVVVGPPNPTEGEARKGFVRRGGNRE